ncbi:Molecular chaperone HSP20 family, IbpA [Methanonatronarchaeum thermophilum]|uniref:Molecular chaperone HSP20 family, IbpA n=1 Tax=Methanonatronarchaeum thermophilum TaxID=1927129 RepID=A0A1Y3GCJ2_9EURY|nr:hypothetical protein [Methanonatronarchaeum thermophilum]OUJ19158.1 Molecular chaperone HSP20 family, IbpA [Methanonatronarchaeum thermophilum]
MGEDWLSKSLGKIFRRMGSSFEEAKKEFKYGYKDSLLESDNTRSKGEKKGKKKPFVDVFKKGDRLKVLVEAPGAIKEKIHIGVYNEDTLHIYIPSKTKEDYSVDIKLPSKVKTKKARYKYNNGVMAVSLDIQD